MKILVTGATGQLGYNVVIEAKKRDYIVFSDYVDITNRDIITEHILNNNPDVVIHCAAYTNVDEAESSKEKCYDVNFNGTKNIVDACKKIKCKMIFISSDYAIEALNYYGNTKQKAENYIQDNLSRYYIVRTSWLYGINGNNFVKAMLNAAKTHEVVKVVNDQIGRPTFTGDLAKLILDMAEKERYGLYNACNEGGNISWCDFTKEIYKMAGVNTKIEPVSTDQYGMNIAVRPKNSRLDTSALIKNGFKLLPTWEDALNRFLNEQDERINHDKNI